MLDPVVLAFEDREYRRAELDAYVNGLTATLMDRGVAPGDRVALMATNRPEFVMSLYAVWRAGAAVVLISSSWKRAEVAHVLELTRPVLGVGDQPLLAEFLPYLSLDEPIALVAGAPLGPGYSACDDAVFVFSSGTTGMPKAVRHTHGAFAAAIGHWRDALQLGPTDRLQIFTPPSHILGLLNIATVLDAGGWLRLHRRFDVDAMLAHIEKDRITVEMAVAPIALAIAAHPVLERYDLSSLRYVMWCATPVTESVAHEVTRRTGVSWVTAYGTSELPVLTCNRLVDAQLDTVGRPVPGVRMRVIASETGDECPAGVAGDIVAQSDSVMVGYLPEDQTAEAFLPGADDDRWFRTGDIGYFDDDGWLHITDRAKEMIKVRGFQVAPAEVEAVLHGHPSVTDCAVFGVPDTDGEAVIAAVQLAAPAGEDELADYVGTRLATYKRPRRVLFVPEIPRLPSGKVLRRVLKECYGRTSDQ